MSTPDPFENDHLLPETIERLRFTLKEVLSDYFTLVENLSAVQKRCSELVEENRKLRARLDGGL